MPSVTGRSSPDIGKPFSLLKAVDITIPSLRDKNLDTLSPPRESGGQDLQDLDE